MPQRNQYLKPILDTVYGTQLKSNIHHAIEKVHNDTVDLARANVLASQAADDAVKQADLAIETTIDAIDRVDFSKALVDEKRAEIEVLRFDLQKKLEQGYWNGSKGDRGDRGDDGDDGVTAIAKGVFKLRVNQETGNLYAVYPEYDSIPNFRYDEATGGLYYVIGEE